MAALLAVELEHECERGPRPDLEELVVWVFGFLIVKALLQYPHYLAMGALRAEEVEIVSIGCAPQLTVAHRV